MVNNHEISDRSQSPRPIVAVSRDHFHESRVDTHMFYSPNVSVSSRWDGEGRQEYPSCDLSNSVTTIILFPSSSYVSLSLSLIWFSLLQHVEIFVRGGCRMLVQFSVLAKQHFPKCTQVLALCAIASECQVRESSTPYLTVRLPIRQLI